MLDLPKLKIVLSAVLEYIEPMRSQIEYRIVGTAASLMHGVCLPAGDIDILLKTRAGVDAFSELVSSCECLSPPKLLDGGWQYYAAFEIEGVKVEFSTVEGMTSYDASECMGTGPWTHFMMIPLGERQVHVVSPELRLITEIARQRADRYVPIWECLRLCGYSRDLLLHGLEERSISLDGCAGLESLQRLMAPRPVYETIGHE